jgi:hypothetical protein
MKDIDVKIKPTYVYGNFEVVKTDVKRYVIRDKVEIRSIWVTKRDLYDLRDLLNTILRLEESKK